MEGTEELCEDEELPVDAVVFGIELITGFESMAFDARMFTLREKGCSVISATARAATATIAVSITRDTGKPSYDFEEFLGMH